LDGEVSLSAEAELDGLGMRIGPATAWTVPKGFAQAVPRRDPVPQPDSSPPESNRLTLADWFALMGLLAMVAYFFIPSKNR